MALLWTFLAVALVVFFDWVPTPLNRNTQGMTVRERLPGSVIHGTVGLVVIIADALHWHWVVLAGAMWFSVVLIVAIVNWWVPWLTGITAGEIKTENYEREYARNVRILPRLGRSPIVPDVQHTLIHLAVFAASLANWLAFAAEV